MLHSNRYRFLTEAGEPDPVVVVMRGQTLALEGERWALVDEDGSVVKQGRTEQVTVPVQVCGRRTALEEDPTRSGPCIHAEGHWEPCKTVRALC